MGEWIIKDQLQADWALQKIAEHRKKISDAETRRKKFLEEYSHRCDLLFDDETRESKAAVESLTKSLKDFLFAQGKKKLRLPFGKISFTDEFLTASGEKAKADNSELLTICKEKFPQFVKSKTVETADWSSLKKLLTVDEDGDVTTADGEIIRGLIVAQNFKVSTLETED